MPYIDRDLLIQKANEEYSYGYITAREIAKLPTADVAPVRHGKWIPKEYMVKSPFAKNYNCSVCGEESFTTKHCPNCGALMDKE